MARKKAAPVDVPQTEVEARHLAASYASMVGEIEAIDAERKIRIAEVNRDCDARIGQRASLLDGMFARLKGWWEAHGERIAGKRRSAEFAGLNVGYRMTPPALKLPKGMTPVEVVSLLGEQAPVCLRRKLEIDRELIIKSLLGQGEHALRKAVLAHLGFTLTQRDEFFVDVLPRDAGDAA